MAGTSPATTMLRGRDESCTASLNRLSQRLSAPQILRVEDQPPGADGDQQHRGYVARPGDGKEWPGRQMKVDGEDVVVAGCVHLVEQRVGLYRHHEQQYQRGEHVNDALLARADIGPDKIDRDVPAAITRCRDAPEDQNAEQELAEVVAVGNRHAEEITQEHRYKDVGR